MSDELLVVLSKRGEVGWPTFRDHVATLLARPEHAAWRSHAQRPETVLLNALASLGHVVSSFDAGQGRVRIAPRVLARLPEAGRPRAVLVGHRMTSTEDDLRSACARHGATLTVENGGAPLVPHRLIVEADGACELQAVAQATEALFHPDPAAWRLLHVAANLAAYRRGLTWYDLCDLNWEREDFDPQALRFVPAADRRERDGLARFRDPTIRQWRFWLREGPQTAEVARDWGRYLTLEQAGRNVLTWAGEDLAVPLGALPPAPLATALGLCSGRAPRLLRPSAGALPFLVYSAVPRLLAEQAAAKLGQTLVEGPSLSE